jgi:hypothetical protein
MGIGFLADLDEKVEVRPTDNGDHDLFAHYANKDDIMNAMVNGVPIMAICGKVWIPSRDGSKFPVCPECKDIYEQLPKV